MTKLDHIKIPFPRITMKKKKWKYDLFEILYDRTSIYTCQMILDV